MTSGRKRGPYRKGLERREQILQTALEVFAEQGDRGTSFQEIADRIGVTQPALLYYFGTREELLLAVLRRRDEIDRALAEQERDPVTAVTDAVRHNAEVPGLVKLHVALSAAATDPDHHAHQYFTDRYRRFGREIAEGLAEGQRSGWIRDDESPERLARLLLAAIDGLQTQWLMDSSIDMPKLVETFIRLCMPPSDAH
ncbi:TetR/AcrR family transcriptional regulator [Actinomadura fibrosa]|uniref:TetR/AcrR family transcriptional regulator n=1 Tax=Actinomadura fibrosa TaxID=111802 RepID=A0ABW2XNX2_9ACTN|nr:TetR/AcrR family transcriptional regulator [Actinomadura fibrosa]